jgi:hypothetical protein
MKKILFESGIRVPKGVKAAKVLYHSDTDGIFSAILTVNQLEKQGIPKNKIKLEPIQFGSKPEEYEDRLKKSKGQMVAVVDFPIQSRISSEKLKDIDFHSDHHIERIGKKASRSDERAFLTFRHLASKKYSPSLFNKFINLLERIALKFDGKDENDYLYTKLIDPLTFWKNLDVVDAGKKIKESDLPKELKEKVLEKYREHYKKTKKINEAVKTKYPSETEHLHTVHASGLADSRTIKAISNIDSAKYKDLEDTVFLTKEFKEKGRMDRLANIVNVLITELIKTNPNAVNSIIKSSSPSLVSVYNNLLKHLDLNNKQVAAIKEITKENPDWEKIESSRKSMPTKEMAQDIRKGAKLQTQKGLEAKRENFEKILKKSTDIKTTDFKGKGNVIIQVSSGRSQPTRYMGSLMSKADNTRYAAIFKQWPTMIQVALNPDLENRHDIDLEKIMRKALENIKDKYMNKYNRWAFDIISKESGGHKAITNVSGLGTIGIMPKLLRNEYYRLLDLSKKVKNKKRFKELAPKMAQELDKLEKTKKDWAEKRKKIIEELKRDIISMVNYELKNATVNKPLKNQEKFKAKKSIKEDILHNLNYRF